MINQLGILKYAEQGAMQELTRRGELARKHNYATIYMENMRTTLENLEQIRAEIDVLTYGGVKNDK